jgi:transposase
MQKPKRRQYTAAFRHAAVRLITEQGYGVTAAARSFGINTNMLGRWKRQSEQQRHGSARGNGPLSAEHDELGRLRQEVKRLRIEREIVKKAALFFANESR